MAKLTLAKASTDVSVYVFIQNNSVTTGAGLTGLVYNSASLTCYYVRPGAAAAALSLATQTTTGAHSDGGFIEVDATNMPGVYRLDLSDAVCATGVNSVVVMLKGAADMAPCLLEIQLSDFNLNSSTPNVNVAQISGDSTAADNAEAFFDGTGYAGTNNVIPTVTTVTNQVTAAAIRTEIDSNSTQLAAIVADTGELQTDWANGGRLDLILDARASQTSVDTIDGIVDSVLVDTGTDIPAAIAALSVPTAAAVADAVWDEAKSGHTASGSFGEEVQAHATAAEVNAEVVDALATDTYAEPGQGTPSATLSIAAKINYMFKSWRNKKDNDGSTTKLYADDGTTVDQKQTTSESGGTVTKGEWTTGP